MGANRTHGVTRRSLLVGAGALGVLAACQVGAPASSGAPAVQPSATAARAAVQRLRIGHFGEPANLDPNGTLDAFGDLMSSWVVAESLIDYSYDGKMTLEPRLATAWRWVDDKTFQFTLRRGVKFHNGKELKVEDVQFTIQRILDPATASRWRSNASPIASVDQVDEYTGVIKLKDPFPGLETFLLPQNVVIVPKGSTDALKTSPIGTGPFKFKEWTKGQRIVLERNPDYWQPGKPILESIEFNFMTQYQTRLAALRAGEIEHAEDILPSDLDALGNERGIVAQQLDSLAVYYFVFNITKPPFNSVNARQAVRLAVNRDLVNRTAMAGRAKPNYVNEYLGSPYNDGSFAYQRDLDRAKQLVTQSGGPFEFEMISPNTAKDGGMNDAVAFSVGEAGIRVRVTKLPIPEFIDRHRVRRTYDAALLTYGPLPDPDAFHFAYAHSKGSLNVFGYNNPSVDVLLEEGRRIIDPAKRKDIYKQVFTKVYQEDALIVPLLQDYRAIARRDKVKNWKQNSTFRVDYRDVFIEA